MLPYGKVGELYIGGLGLARGYSDKTLTKQSFVNVNGERFYKSGDLVYRKPDNELIFYGRKDNQIKLNGFRIELEEIEKTIRMHRAVKESAVIVKKNGNAELLCAYYTADHNIPQEELKKLLAGRLPYYMVPAVFQRIETLPITVNGKVDKCRLAEIEVQLQQQYTAPETAQQKILTTILEELLEIEKIGIDDNFFDIGGDSLLVASYAAYGAFSAAMITVVVAFLQVNNTILKDISFSIRPKEYVGVVGSSGSGKSTLLKLLLGFEQPTVGRIYFDDKDIDSLDKRELRRRFGVVLQDGQLISGSIYENIVITAANITNKKVLKVIRDVGLEQDIAEMPMGLHTVIAEGASTISGGQRQRIQIARAIVNRPSILFFDEATSALDNVNQALVCESLEKLNATRVVIAHRLSTVINCDRIIVLEEGRIAEQGSYQELMEQKGRFYDLTRRQIV